ncbi:substrate-binding periplasmic protein [Pseudoduganella violaceinigra]|uniref:substrate-binding periplasmic protein n=1 Tax=Pseudoduganella violaceinigra TaxID=246602 RepID=UPI0009FCDAC2|nr:transporter substrate-binding domain-containing protein [Pseudoduganella violaceinigra]
MRTSPMTAMAMAQLLAAALPCAAANEDVLVLHAMGQESLPPKWLLSDGQAAGLCPDILAAIARLEPRLRFTGQQEFRSVLVIEQGLLSGSVHVACALLDTATRREIADPVEQPLYISRQRLAAAAGDTAVVNNLDDLARLKPLVNTSRGAAYIDFLRDRGIEVDDSTGANLTNLKKILAGHGRFFYMNELTLHWLIRENKLQDKIKLMPAVLKADPLYLWVSKKAPPQAFAMLANAIGRLQDSGELARIYARWAGESGVRATN